MSRPILLTLLCGGLVVAQQQTPPPQDPSKTPAATQPATPEDPTQKQLIFREQVTQVQAPVLVFDRDGNYVDGLQPFQFHLFDNGKEQNISVDVTYQPIS